jgi:hypothetical protein
MKKNLFILAAAGIALASCSSDDLISENAAAKGGQPMEIALTPIAQPGTRGQYAVLTAGFPEDNTMEVKAYQSSATAGAYFDKTTFGKDGTTWKGTTPQYWPLSEATINFFAVSGYGIAANKITITDLLASATVDYSAPTYSATTQSDIMYAFNRGEVTKTGNALSFNSSSPVSMQFKHALALVEFQVKGATATEVSAITVNSITLKDATYNGNLSLENTNAATESATVTTAVNWTPGASVDEFAVPGITANTAITADYARIGNGLMIIPTTGFSSFVINYTMNGHNYDYEYTPTTAVTSVAAGTKYIYQINFKLHEIEIAPTVAAWADGGTTPITVVD